MDIKKNILLKKHTTFKIGGPAKYFVEVVNIDELKKAISFAKDKKIDYYILGNGSNLLVSDQGFNGLVIKNKIDFIKTISKNEKKIIVQAGAGTQLNALIAYLLKKAYLGLHYFSYIPATVGGAVYINVHYLKHLLSDFFIKGSILDKSGKIISKDKDYFRFSYDYSYLKDSKEALVSATFKCLSGDLKKARQEREVMLERRKIYPPLSAGCIWQNLKFSEQKKHKLSHGGVGYLIDKALLLKGFQSGEARICPDHAAFIENMGNAKASDVVSLIKKVKDKAKKKLELDLRLEIELLGFTKTELSKIIN